MRSPKSQEERYRETLDFLWRQERQWSPIHQAIDEEVGFIIDGLHYDDDAMNRLEKNSRFVRWTGQESFNAWRHEVGNVTSVQGPMQARPVDEYGDPDLADVAVQLLTDEIERPDKEFEDVMEDVVGAASACGYGVSRLEFLPHAGEWGEILAVPQDPRQFGWDATVKSVHSPKCRFIWWRFRMRKSEALERCGDKDGEGWNRKVVEAIEPDAGPSVNALGMLRSAPFVPLESRTGSVTNLEDPFEDEFTGYVIMFRSAEEYATASEDTRIYEPDERYMRCVSCGYKTEMQGRLAQELPDVLPGGCPECAGDLHRVDGQEREVTTLAYPRGKMCIIAPYGGVNDYIYEDKWQFQTRSFPVMVLSRFRHPFRHVGPSLASLNWWNQIATDMIMRVALERMIQTTNYWRAPRDGYVDAYGQPFEFTDENGWVMFYEGDSPPLVDRIEGAEIPANWHTVYNLASQALTAHMGIADWGLTPEQSRDIPASSVAQQVQQQEIPLRHYQRRYQRQRGLYLGVYYDMIRATYTMERIYRLRGPDGLDTVRALAASDMPNFDFYLSDAPDLSPGDEGLQRATDALIMAIEQRPWAVDLIARGHKFSPSLVRKAKEDFQKYQTAQAEAAATAAANPLPLTTQAAGSIASLSQGMGRMTQPAGV